MGLAQGAFVLFHSGTGSSETISVKGMYQPKASDSKEEVTGVFIAPEALDFGRAVESVAMSRSVVLSNQTRRDINISNISIDTSDNVGFTYKSRCGDTLKVGDSCVIVINWKPSITGAAQGVLAVSHNGEGAMATVEIKGEYAPVVVPEEKVEEGSVSISPAILDFGTVVQNTLLSRSVVLNNTTQKSVNLSSISIDASKDAGFDYKSRCPATLTAGGSCVIVVSWTPAVSGNAQGVLTVEHSGKQIMANLELQGVYQPPVTEDTVDEGKIIISPDALDFGTTANNASMSRSVVLSNKTRENITISNIAIDTSDNVGLNFRSRCPQILKAGSACVIVVDWKPTTAGTAQGVLTVSHNGEEAVSTLEVKGEYTLEQPEAVAEGSVTISPDSLDFGTADTNTLLSRSVVLSNGSNSDINIKEISIDADNSLGFNYRSRCPAVLKAGGNCAIIVNWKPSVAGAAQGVLTVNHSGKEAMAALELKGSYNESVSEADAGSVALSPATVDFGTASENTLLSRSLTLSNTTAKNLNITNIVIDGDAKSGLTYKSHCPAILNAGGNCTVVINWKPETKGAINGVLTVSHDGKETMSAVEISGTYAPEEVAVAEEGAVTISPEALDFGTASGKIALSRSIVLNNATSKDINLSGINIDAPAEAGFSYSSKCPAVLSAGGECLIVVTWKPNTEGLVQGVLAVNHNGKATMATVELQATYTPPEMTTEEEGVIAISPEALDFGVADNTTSMSRSVVLNNGTKENVNLSSITIDADSSLGFNYKSYCPATLTAGGNCTIVVSWKPSVKGAAHGVLMVNHDGKSKMASLELSGTYTPPEEVAEEEGAVAISPEALDFGDTANTTLMSRSVVLTNGTSKDINLLSIAVDAANELGFDYKSHCPITLTAGSNCTIVVSWKPNAKGAAHGVLMVNHDGKSKMASLELSGIYTPPEEAIAEEGVVTVTPETVDFGSTPNKLLVSRSLTINNGTSNSIMLGEISINAQSDLGFNYSSKCPAELKAGGSCALVVTWEPKEKGSAHGVITIAHSGKQAMAVVEMQGEYAPVEETAEEEGVIAISPEALDFGTADNTTSMSRSVVLNNGTKENVNLSSITIDADSSLGFNYKSYCPATLTAGGNCTIVVSWKPSVKGAAHGVLMVNHDGKSKMASLELSGTYTPPEEVVEEEGAVAISPEALDFGTSAGGMALSRSVVLTNGTKNDIAISNIAIDAADKSGFSFKSKCSGILKAGEECLIVVTWNPETEGLAQGVLSVNHNGKAAMATLELSGTYTPPEEVVEEEGSVAISPEALDFGAADNTTSMSRSVVLTNTTKENVNISSIIIDAADELGYSYKSHCPATLTAGGSCTIIVNWKPSVKGASHGVLTVNHSGKSTMSTLELSGTYTPPEEVVEEEGAVAISPEALDFGTADNTTTMSRSVVLTNDTKENINISSIVIDAADELGFSYKSHCPATLTAGGNCTIVVNWKPSVTGAAHGVIMVNHDGKSKMASLELSGTYTPQVEEGKLVTITPEALDFGTSEGGIAMSRSVMLMNASKENINIKEIEIEASEKAGFSYKSKCPDVLTAGGECLIVVTWLPDAEGAAQGVLSVKHSGKETMATLELSGVHQVNQEDAGTVVAEPESVDFGTFQGNIPLNRPIVLTNNTEEDITINNIEIIAAEVARFKYESKCPAVLKAGSKCAIIVSWMPDTEGAAQGVLNVSHSGKEMMTSVPLTGTYTPAQDAEGSVSMTPTSLDFGTSNGGIPISRSILLSNKTTENIDISSINIDAADRSGFSYKSHCPATLAPSGSCVLVVVWNPTSVGLAQGVMTVNHSGKEAVASLEMTGTFTPDAVTSAEMYPNSSPDEGLLVADKESIDFGSDVDEASSVVISLVNKGNADLTINDMSLSGLNNGIYFANKGCHEDIVLRPGSACPLIINWLPKRVGELTDSLQITHTGSRGILVIPVTGSSSGISEQGIEMEKKATVEKEVGQFFEDYFYDNMIKDGVLDSDTYFDSAIDINKVKKEMVGFSTKEKMKDIRVTSHATDRAVLVLPAGDSVVVRDGMQTIIESVKWTVSIIPEGVLLTSKSGEEVALSFDRTLRSPNAVAPASTNQLDVGETQAITPPNINPAPELNMVRPE